MMAAETCTAITFDDRLSAGRFGSEPVRHCLRDEAKEVRPDARPRPGKTEGVFAAILQYIEDFFWLRTTQMVADRSPQ